MNKKLIALAVASICAGAAHADLTIGDDANSLSFYGTLDIGVGTTNHSLGVDPNSASGNSGLANNQPASTSNANVTVQNPTIVAPKVTANGPVTSLLPSNTTPSKWGFKGVRNLGDGNSAGFVLESQVNINTGTNPNGRLSDSLPGAGTVVNKGEGSIDGQMFDREASVWVKNDQYGMAKFGRMTTVLGDTMGNYDPMNVGYAVSPLGFNGGWGAGAYTGDSRWDNSVKWMNNWGALQVAAGYKFGGFQDAYTMGSAESFKIGYETPKFGVSFAAQSTMDTMLAGNGGTSYPSLALTVADSFAAGIFGRFNVNDDVVLKGGFEKIHLTSPSNAQDINLSNIPQLSGLPVTKVTAYAPAGGYQDQQLIWLGVNYNATAKSTVSIGIYDRQDSFGNGTTNTVNYYSAKYEYKWEKNTTLYVTGVISQVSGDINSTSSWVTTSGTLVPDMITYTAGIVYKF